MVVSLYTNCLPLQLPHFLDNVAEDLPVYLSIFYHSGEILLTLEI